MVKEYKQIEKTVNLLGTDKDEKKLDQHDNTDAEDKILTEPNDQDSSHSTQT